MLNPFLLPIASLVLGQAIQSSSSPVKGSLVVAIPYKDGLLIAADKRAANNQGRFDDFVKIAEADTFTAVASTGTAESGVHIGGEKAWHLNFSATDSICQAIKSQKKLDNDIEPSLASTAESLRKSIINFASTSEGKLLPSGSPLFTSRIFHFNKTTKKFQIATLTLKYDRDQPEQCEIAGGCEEVQVSFCYPQGRAELLYELWKGTDSQFDKLRSNKYVSKFLRNPVPFKQVSQSEARRAALYFISITSKRNQMLVPGDESVSETADIYVISRSHGVKILQNNVRYSQ